MQWRIGFYADRFAVICRYLLEKMAPTRNAQGIEAVSFFAAGKKDTSVKPGPCAVLPYGQVGARMRPN
jgi:hypothetical protein